MDFLRKVYDYLPESLFGKAPVIKPAAFEKQKLEGQKETEPVKADSGVQTIAKYRPEYKDGVCVSLERKDSEDTVLSDQAFGLYGVADGSSSKGGGGEMSRQAVEKIKDYIAKYKMEGMSAEARRDLFRSAVLEAGARMETSANQSGEVHKMNTTFAGYMLDRNIDGGLEATTASVGDSRVYHYKTKESKLVQRTIDDNIIGMMQEFGFISADLAKAIDQSENMAMDLPGPSKTEVISSIKAMLDDRERVLSADEQYRLNEAMGLLKKSASITELAAALYANRDRPFDGVRVAESHSARHRVQTSTFDVEPGDLVMAWSDGMVLPEEEIARLIQDGLDQGLDAQQMADYLTRRSAEDRGPRQKGTVVRDPKTKESKPVGDDLGLTVSKILEQPARRVEAPPAVMVPPAVEAPPIWAKDASRVHDLELTLEGANAPDRFSEARRMRSLPAEWHTGAIRAGEDKKQEMASQGLRFANDESFVAAWKEELRPVIQDARQRLKAVYRGQGKVKELARLEQDELAEAAKAASSYAR